MTLRHLLLAVCGFAYLVLSPLATAGASASVQRSDLQLASVNAAVAAMDNGELLYAKRARHSVPIASISKLMTAVVVLDSGQPLDEWLTVVPRKRPPPNNGYSRIRMGSELRRGALIRIGLMASENLAVHVLASHYPGGRNAFIAAMNDKAAALGMTGTHFEDPSGLSPGNRSTPADLVKLLRAAYGFERIREYTTTTRYTARFRSPRYRLLYGNTNPLVRRDAWDISLSKTGYLNEAGRCLAMVVEIDGEELAVVLLDSFGKRTPLGDAARVRRWLKTGDGGTIADAARAYEQRRAAALNTTTASQ